MDSGQLPSPLFLRGSLGILAGITLPVLLLVGFILLGGRFPFLLNILLGWVLLALGLCLWTWYRLGRWLRARGPWAPVVALASTALGIWSCWLMPMEPLLNRYTPALPLLALGVGLLSEDPGAPQGPVLESAGTRPFRWGLLTGLLFLGFSIGMSSITSHVAMRSMPIPLNWGILTTLSFFVALLLAEACDQGWPGAFIAFLGLALLASSKAFPQKWNAIVTVKPATTLPHVIGLLLGASLVYFLAKRTGARAEHLAE